MTYERWQEIVNRARQQDPQAVISREDLPVGPGWREFIEMMTPAGKVRLELWLRPKILERKTLYSHRMHSAATVQYKYDESEQTLIFKAYRWNDSRGDWQEINADAVAAGL